MPAVCVTWRRGVGGVSCSGIGTSILSDLFVLDYLLHCIDGITSPFFGCLSWLMHDALTLSSAADVTAVRDKRRVRRSS